VLLKDILEALDRLAVVNFLDELSNRGELGLNKVMDIWAAHLVCEDLCLAAVNLWGLEHYNVWVEVQYLPGKLHVKVKVTKLHQALKVEEHVAYAIICQILIELRHLHSLRKGWLNAIDYAHECINKALPEIMD